LLIARSAAVHAGPADADIAERNAAVEGIQLHYLTG
jgi:hypothetical protein